jgi:hypothetical protein
MRVTHLAVIAQGFTSAGERWYLHAGGSAQDYHTLLRTVHADGSYDEGGMGGPLLYPGRLLNVYTGRADNGPLRVIVRADRRVRQLYLGSDLGELCGLIPARDDTFLGITFFASLLPWAAEVTALQGLDADGRVVG